MLIASALDFSIDCNLLTESFENVKGQLQLADEDGFSLNGNADGRIGPQHFEYVLSL